MPFLAPGRPRAEPGCSTTPHHDHQPARRRGVGAADVAAAGSAEDDRLQRVAPQHRRRAVRDRSRLPPAAPSAAAARRARARSPSRSPGAEAPAAVEAWRRSPTRCRGARTARSSPAAPPGLHATRSAARSSSAGARSARWARSTRPCWPLTASTERVAWVEVDLGRLLDAAARRAAVPADQPLPVERHRPRVRDADAVPAARRRDGAAAGRPATSWSTSSFRRLPGRRPAPGTRSLAYRLRLQAADRTLTDAEVAEVRQRCIDAVLAATGATCAPDRATTVAGLFRLALEDR